VPGGVLEVDERRPTGIACGGAGAKKRRGKGKRLGPLLRNRLVSEGQGEKTAKVQRDCYLPKTGRSEESPNLEKKQKGSKKIKGYFTRVPGSFGDHKIETFEKLNYS